MTFSAMRRVLAASALVATLAGCGHSDSPPGKYVFNYTYHRIVYGEANTP